MTLSVPPFKEFIASAEKVNRGWHQWFNNAWRAINGLEYKSYCFVHKDGTAQNITAANEALLTWAVADYDTQSEVDLANEKWVCGKAGVYLVSCTVSFAVDTDQDRLYLNVYKDATKIIQVRSSAAATGDEALSVSHAVYLAKNEEITFKVENTDNNDTIRGGSHQTFFSIYRLGD